MMAAKATGEEPNHATCEMPLELRNPEYQRGFFLSPRERELSDKVSRFLNVINHISNDYVQALGIGEYVLQVYWPNMNVFDMELLLEGCRLMAEIAQEKAEKMQAQSTAHQPKSNGIAGPQVVTINPMDKWR